MVLCYFQAQEVQPIIADSLAIALIGNEKIFHQEYSCDRAGNNKITVTNFCAEHFYPVI